MKSPCLGWWLLLTTLTYPATAQNKYMDSLKRELARPQADTSRVLGLAELSILYARYSTDSGLLLAQQSLSLAREKKYGRGEAWALIALGIAFRRQGDLPQAMEYSLRALDLARAVGDRKAEARAINTMGLIYEALQDYRQALHFYQQAQKIFESLHRREEVAYMLLNQSNTFIDLKLLNSSYRITLQAYQVLKDIPENNERSEVATSVFWRFGRIQYLRGNAAEALQFYRKALALNRNNGNLWSSTRILYQMAEAFQRLGQIDSSLHYAQLSLATSKRLNSFNMGQVCELLSKLYEVKKQPDSAYYYQGMAMKALSEMYGPQKVQQLQRLVLQAQQRQQAQQTAQKDYQNRVRLYILLGGLGVALLIALIFYRNNRQQRKANRLLQRQRDEISSQRTQLQTTLTDLRATQAQLIQKEKMASLGELTAGIAHEIQNPLNFVNNYSEVNVELLDELDEEIKKGDLQEVQAIANDLRENESKIHHHGRRADAIVRGMLEHARATPGERQPTDLNQLADEYLRLAYQGLRAKEADFQCELVTDFDANVGEVEVVAPDIGRVLLNLYNNAFYAVRQKALVAADQAYVPTVWVSTTKLPLRSDGRLQGEGRGEVQIRVRDNGTGMPEAIREKIFQPFFTTKPTGEGTGLGLSLSYDIVTKGHGGTLSVASEVGGGTEFVVGLPV